MWQRFYLTFSKSQHNLVVKEPSWCMVGPKSIYHQWDFAHNHMFNVDKAIKKLSAALNKLMKYFSSLGIKKDICIRLQCY